MCWNVFSLFRGERLVMRSVRLRPWQLNPSRILFLFNFFSAKGAIYLTPLIIAALIKQETYGELELAWSAGTLISGLTVTIPFGGITQRYLIGNDPHVDDELVFISAASSFLSLAISILIVVFAGPSALALVAAICPFVLLQTLLTTLNRIRGHRNRNAWSDGFSVLSTGVVLLFFWALRAPPSLTSLVRVYIPLSAALIGIYLMLFARLRHPDLMRRIGRSIKVGLPMASVGAMAVWLGVGGRLTMGLIDPTAVAPYSIAYRIALLSFGFHQLVSTAIFVRLYKARTREGDRLFALPYALIAIVTFCIGFGTRPLIGLVEPAALAAIPPSVFVMLPVVGLQVFFWIGFGMLQLRINRTGTAAKAFWPIVAVTLGGIGALFGINAIWPMTTLIVCWAIALHSAAYFAVAWWTLAARRLPHRLIGLVGLVGGIALGASALGLEIWKIF